MLKNDVPFFLYEFFSKQLLRLFAMLFNLLIINSFFPTCWRTAIITPIPKIGKDNRLISNYRPISMLPTLSKLFEKVILRRLSLSLVSNNIIPDFQFGSTKNKSTCHALALLYNQIAKGLNEHNLTSLVTLDIQNAFNTVWHNGLLFKLNKFGVSPILIVLIRNFLCNRKFCIKINGFISRKINMEYGLPQGSVLSPILFNIFLADIISHNQFGIIQFADDLIVFSQHQNPTTIGRLLNRFLNNINRYLNNWKLKLNISKSNFINIIGDKDDISKKLKKSQNE